MPIQRSGGAMTHFLQSGNGPEPALVFHPMLSEARSLDLLMAKLGEVMSMNAPDMPGHGQSDAWDRDRDYAEMALAMGAGLMDERPAHLVGHSFGGYLALRYAAENPDLVLSLTLIEPVFFAAATESDPALLKSYAKEAGSFMQAIAVGDLISAARGFTAKWGDGRPWEALKPDVQDYITERMPLIAAGEAALAQDNAGVLPKVGGITAPCLLLEGEKAHPIVRAILDALEAKLPNSDRLVIQEAGHMAPLTHADVVAGAIRDFLSP